MHLAKACFTETILKVNHRDTSDFQCWAFLPGMGYGSIDKWWGDFGKRDFPHEGVDICLYANRRGEVRRLAAATRIPVMQDGIVRAIFKDYLGHAIIVEHGDEAGRAGNHLSVYAHTCPRDDLRSGTAVRAGEVIATIADTRRSKAQILPHLHLSLAIPSPNLNYENFVWNIMRDPQQVTLLDPMHHLDGEWRKLDHGYDDGLGFGNQQK